jgi:selenocysteine-specific elongation factor
VFIRLPIIHKPNATLRCSFSDFFITDDAMTWQGGELFIIILLMTRHFILGTAGHIDHGKTTLIHALTGINPDRLPEEKARGMTIELGFAHLTLADAVATDTTYQLGVIDVPGHADFVRNMLAGVSSIDIALFIVAADDGWMPQSEEHLQVLSYLGIKNAVIALTKADLAEDIDFCVEMLREEVAGTFLEKAPIIPVSAHTGKGLDELKNALSQTLRAMPNPAENGKMRLCVDRVFSPTGVGTVVTGTLTGAAIAAGASITVMAKGLEGQVRGVQSHGSKKDHARPSMRTALNLSGLIVEGEDGRRGVARGDVITVSRWAETTHTVDVIVEKTSRSVAGAEGFSRPLRQGQRVRVHHGSATHEARLYFLESRSLGPGDSCLGELRFSAPIHAFNGDHFVLRDWSKRYTLAGGIMLDVQAKRSQFRKAAQRPWLETSATALHEADTILHALLTRDHVIVKEQALRLSRFSEAEVKKAGDQAVKNGHFIAEGPWWILAAWWDSIIEQTSAAIKTYHQEHPEAQGIPLSILRAQIEPLLPDAKVFDGLISHLTRSGFTRDGELLKSGTHRATLPANLAKEGQEVRAALIAGGIEPPNPQELAPTPTHQKVLRFLIQSGEAIDLGEKAVLSRESYDQLCQIITDTLQTKGKATASEIREVTQTTRRILIPLLEKLDKLGLTQRQGDYRSLKANA